MSTAPSPARLARRIRTERLAGQSDHASELLEFFGRLLGAQDLVYGASAAWLDGLGRYDAPYLDWNQFPFDDTCGMFREFVGQVETFAPQPLAAPARRMRALPGGELADVLRAFVVSEPDRVTPADTDLHVLMFFPRAFLQPVAEAFAESHPRGAAEGERLCSVCGSLPQVSVLRDDWEVKGQRLLICALCVSEWRFPRLTCPGCGCTDKDALLFHEAEDAGGHVRIDECTSCRHYMKTIDLRKNGTADPFADDIASVALDLWAADHGLTRICPGLLGF